MFKRFLMLLVCSTLILSITPPQFIGSVTAETNDSYLPKGSENEAASTYYQLLLKHTRWVETQWNEEEGHYNLSDYSFVSVLGNAVLLKFGSYDADLTGVSRDILKDHTLRTIRHFAASNYWAGGNEWGGKIFWDGTYESYFVAAAKLMWSELDDSVREDINAIAVGGADYVADLGTNEDPRSGGWSSNGLDGSYKNDSKIEEMGAKSMPLATGLAYAPDHPAAIDWREWLTKWISNLGGLPVADKVNPTLIDGKPVSEWNQAHNIYETFLVENHRTFAPHYQQSTSAYPGRNIIHFLIAKQPIPEVLKMVPNGDELWETLAHLGTDAGVAEHFMVADRHHLYGRDVLPLAYRSTVLGDPYAVRAEMMLLEHLIPYQEYPPVDRLTKFSGEPKYEPEARAEVAMAYLLHYWRDHLSGDVEPVTKEEYFKHFSGVKDYGPEVGLVAHQTTNALAAAVSKPGYVKFAFLPQHDDWFLNVAGNSASFLPSTSLEVTGQSVKEYHKSRDGLDGSATLFRTEEGFAGFTTLPTGSVVYATSGLGSNEGVLNIYNLSMPGVPGLEGSRTFYANNQSFTLTPEDGGGDVDEIHFSPTDVRHVRMLGVRPGTIYGYSIWDFEVYSEEDGLDLALNRPTTASSYFSSLHLPEFATDGNPETRWAVSRPDRNKNDSWIAVDLGSVHKVQKVSLSWDTAFGDEYRIQGSLDGENWFDLETVTKSRTFDSNWLNIDGKVGFVVRGSKNPIRVGPTSVVLSDGSTSGSSGMIVEGYAGQSPEDTAQQATAHAPYGDSEELKASNVDGFLSLFNLGEKEIKGTDLIIPTNKKILLYRGTQETTNDGTVYKVELDPAQAVVEPPRFELKVRKGKGLSDKPKLRVEVFDSKNVRVSNLSTEDVAQVELRSLSTGERKIVTVPAGKKKVGVFSEGLLTPTNDLARSRTTFPSSPLPADMTDPNLAVDGDLTTCWKPGKEGRMVVDLGSEHAINSVTANWSPGRLTSYRIEISEDGLTWTELARSEGDGQDKEFKFGSDTHARYVAVKVEGWSEKDACLAELHVYGETLGTPEDGDADSAANIITRVERFAEEEAFENDSVVRSLTVHLTAVSRYEEKGLAEKIVKHMEGFKLLLDHQKENELISKKAYNALYSDAKSLIKKSSGTPEGGDGGVDEISFTPTEVRYVRMLGVKPANQYGYSLWDFEVYSEEASPDLALNRPTVASSYYSSSHLPEFATDGNPETRWAVSVHDRDKYDSWIAVDLESVHKVQKVILSWDPAFAEEYRIQGSLDGENWFDLETVPKVRT